MLPRHILRSSHLLAVAIVVSAPAGAVTKTYTNPANLAVPCNTSQTSTVTVPLSGTITDVNVLDVTYWNPELGDTTITLTDPTGTVTVQLKDSADGGTGDRMNGIDFDDAAASSFPGFLANGSCISPNTYRPSGDLSDFNGLEANGVWTLTVSESDCSDASDCDCDAFNVGPACQRGLKNWGLEITFSCDSVTIADETLATMQARQACRVLTAGPALSVTTDLGATLSAGESVGFVNGFTVNANAELTVTSCDHDICDQNLANPLSASCMPCVESICAADPFCCNTLWDGTCVNEVETVCGLGC